jgi:hypothetical protein
MAYAENAHVHAANSDQSLHLKGRDEMSKRREISGKYRMEVTASEDCPKCFGTGIELEQTPNATSRRVEINLAICMCVRVLPRLVHDPNAREAPHV